MFEHVAFSYLSHSPSECILVILLQLPCLSVVQRAAVRGLLGTTVYHVSSTLQGFIKSKSWEIWTNQICANTTQLLSFFMFIPASFNTFSFHSNCISLFISFFFLQRVLWCTKAAWEHLGKARFARTEKQTHSRAIFFLVDQFIYLWRQRRGFQ